MKYVLYTMLFIFSLFYSGIVLVVGWESFLVPLGLPAISIPHALGLSTLASLLSLNISAGLSQLIVAEKAEMPYVSSWTVYQLMKTVLLAFMFLFSALM